MGKPVVIAVVGDNRDLKNSLNDSESRLSKFGSNARKAGKIAAIGLGAGVAVGAAALFSMGKAAAEDAQGQAILKNALKKTAGATDAQVRSTENWITAQGKAFGVADDKLRPALATLAGVTHDVGKSQKLASLAMNISARTGQDLEGVSKKLAKGYLGTVGGLKAYGVQTKDADGKARSFADIQDELSKKFAGSASASANTFQGKMSRLKLMFDETKESIGARLLPAATNLANWFFRDGLPAIQKFGNWFQKNLLPPLRELGENVLTGLKGAFDQFKKALKDAQPALTLYGNYFKNVLLPGLKLAAKVILPAIGLALRATGKALAIVGTAGTSMWNNVLAPVFRFFATAVSKVLGGLAKMFTALGHVPGMGWAKTAGRDLGKAATAAGNLADGIKAIPSQKSIKFSLVMSARDRAILENKGSKFVESVLQASPRTTTPYVAPRLSTSVQGATTGGVTISNLVVQVPVGASSVDIGRELAEHLSQYFAVGGARP